MIPHETIEEVKSRIDIVDVISDFVSLKKAGQNYKALSPFTNEKTPSFFVVPSKGIFKDFSSGKGGDAISFLIEHEGMTYTEAIRFLAKKYGVEIQEEKYSDAQQAEASERESMFILMNFAKNYYQDILNHNDEGQSIGLSYFKERGFTKKTIEKFELGYALDEWEAFQTEAIKKGHNKDLLTKTGLVVSKEDGSTYDRFRGRVIFPVHSLAGKIVAFGARILGKEKDGKKSQPKYINSPETDIYHKSQVLYGLYQGKNSIRQEDECFLVEGYTDVISLHQSDVENVVSSSGTALTEDQIKLIRRFSENVTVLFDGDEAGVKAALRGIDLILKGGLNVRVVLFPDGEDPDSYSTKLGTSEFKKYISEHKQDFISFKADLYAREAAGDPIRKAESIKEIVSSIALIPDPVKRSVYTQETSQLLKISEAVLLTELNKILIQTRRKKEKERNQYPEEYPVTVDPVIDVAEASKTDPVSLIQFQEKETIRLLLNYAEKDLENQKLSDFLIHELEDVEFSNPVFKSIYKEFKEHLINGKAVDSKYFTSHKDPQIRNMVTEMITSRYETSDHWADKYHIVFPKENELLDKLAYTNVLRLKLRVLQKMMEENLLVIKEAESGNDWDKLDKTLTDQEGLKQAEKNLADLLGIVVSK
ncbi:MAG: DNA primase [Flammeovirgaceae bacterium]|nr:DNA primase [Flammeovirgaceae bacterium]